MIQLRKLVVSRSRVCEGHPGKLATYQLVGSTIVNDQPLVRTFDLCAACMAVITRKIERTGLVAPVPTRKVHRRQAPAPGTK